jgi:hypothetical protein
VNSEKDLVTGPIRGFCALHDGIPDGPAAPSPEQTPESSVVDPMVMVPLRGTEALLIQSNDGRGRLIWIEGPLQFTYLGQR